MWVLQVHLMFNLARGRYARLCKNLWVLIANRIVRSGAGFPFNHRQPLNKQNTLVQRNPKCSQRIALDTVSWLPPRVATLQTRMHLVLLNGQRIVIQVRG